MKTTELTKVQVTRRNPHSRLLQQWQPARQWELGNRMSSTND